MSQDAKIDSLNHLRRIAGRSATGNDEGVKPLELLLMKHTPG
jgi:hypothetical protein